MIPYFILWIENQFYFHVDILIVIWFSVTLFPWGWDELRKRCDIHRYFTGLFCRLVVGFLSWIIFCYLNFGSGLG